jgi:hypothetical protein
VAVGRDREVILCRLPKVSVVQRLTNHRSSVWALGFDSTGRWLASGDSEGSYELRKSKLEMSCKLLQDFKSSEADGPITMLMNDVHSALSLHRVTKL